ncbi:MAG: energy-coupled thiamine transporter ThiT [Clostridiales bacterium]|nr:energy-coupled thiamine transporter ThiT [Clostridiales bacterium]
MFDASFTEMTVFERCATIALYLTLVLIILALISRAVVKKFKTELLSSFDGVSIGLGLGYAIGLLGTLFYLKLDEYIISGYIEGKYFYPVAALLLVLFSLSVAGFIISVFKKDKLKLFSKIAFLIVAALAIALFIASLVDNYKNGGASDALSEALLYIFTAIIVALNAALAFVFGKKEAADKTRATVYGAICITISFALSYIRFFELPLGGSVTFASLVPLMVYSYMFGVRKGVLAGFVYGLLQFIQAPWFVHPVQFLLDYPIAFMAIGLSGLIKETGAIKKYPAAQFAIGGLIGVTLRYLSHVISGIFVWGSGDPENYGAVAWSFLYNSFALADFAIALVAGCLLFASKTFLKQINKAANPIQKKRAETPMAEPQESTGSDIK